MAVQWSCMSPWARILRRWPRGVPLCCRTLASGHRRREGAEFGTRPRSRAAATGGIAPQVPRAWSGDRGLRGLRTRRPLLAIGNPCPDLELRCRGSRQPSVGHVRPTPAPAQEAAWPSSTTPGSTELSRASWSPPGFGDEPVAEPGKPAAEPGHDAAGRQGCVRRRREERGARHREARSRDDPPARAAVGTRHDTVAAMIVARARTRWADARRTCFTVATYASRL
jgi:hypothetical protein